MVEFHGKTESIDQDHGKNSIFKDWRGHKSPKFVLNGIFRDVPSYWFGIQGKFDTISLQKKERKKKDEKKVFFPRMMHFSPFLGIFLQHEERKRAATKVRCVLRKV